MKLLFLALVVVLFVFKNAIAVPCQQRHVDGDPNKVICVCNATYCDTVERLEPEAGKFITYTSSKAGSRFSQGGGDIVKASKTCKRTTGKTINLHPDRTFQTFIGFGGAATDAAGFNWKSLPQEARTHLINSYFSKDGIEYSMIRVPIGSSDFTNAPYYYNEYPVNDFGLTNFTFTPHDKELKMPMIRAAMEAAAEEVLVLGTTWSPPPWMKIEHKASKTSRLKKEHFQTYADYHCKFVNLYESAGIPIWGITTTNEPIDGTTFTVPFQTLGWTISDMKTWFKENLGPTIQKCNDKPIKVLALDDQKFMLSLWALRILSDPDIQKYMDGVATHSYANSKVPGSLVNACMKGLPDKFVLSTEYSYLAKSGESPVGLGEWQRAEDYAVTIIDDLVHNSAGFIDWNLALDLEGGPNWAKNYVDSTVIVNATAGEFYKQPMFYVMGHFSKFVPRGSKRIHTTKKRKIQDTDKKNTLYVYPDRMDVYDHVAFLTPKNTIVVIIANYYDSQSASLRFGNKQVDVWMEANSIVTVEFPYTQA